MGLINYLTRIQFGNGQFFALAAEHALAETRDIDLATQLVVTEDVFDCVYLRADPIQPPHHPARS